MNRKKIDIVLNILIIILEIIGLFKCFKSLGFNSLIYYTQLSNIFLFISSLLFLFKKRIKSRIVDLFKFGSTLSVMITFLVVLFVLSGYYNLHWLLFEEANLYLHFLCPILGLIAFMFFDDIYFESNKDIFLSLIFTIIYSVVLIILNILRLVSGPYPFLLVYKNPIYITFLWLILIEGGAILISFLLKVVKQRICK